jgi:hypothetical protein
VLQPQVVTVVDSEEDSEIVAGVDVVAEAVAVVAVVAGEAEARKRRTGFQ